MTLRDRFLQMISEEQRTVDFFNDSGARQLQAEGFGDWKDVTEEMIAQAKERISLYESLVAKIDSKSDGNG